jgi:anti-sigma factor RsiW
MEAILDGEGEALTRKAVELALGGDTVALRLCLDRMMPVRKDRPITFTLPAIDTPADLTKATSALLQGVADGEITPSEAAELSKLIDAHVKAIEAKDFAERLAALEQASGGKR